MCQVTLPALPLIMSLGKTKLFLVNVFSIIFRGEYSETLIKRPSVQQSPPIYSHLLNSQKSLHINTANPTSIKRSPLLSGRAHLLDVQLASFIVFQLY